MGMREYEAASQMVKHAGDDADFEGARPDSPDLIERAEAVLGVEFPPTYRRFLAEYGAGDLLGFEFYGLVGDDFETAMPPLAVGLTRKFRDRGDISDDVVVIYNVGDGTYYGIATAVTDPDGEAAVVEFVPGRDTAGSRLNQHAPDFGTWFLERVRFALD